MNRSALRAAALGATIVFTASNRLTPSATVISIPAGGSVNPEAAEKAVQIGPHGVIAATFELPSRHSEVLRRTGVVSILRAPVPANRPDLQYAELELGAIAENGTVLANAHDFFDGAQLEDDSTPLIFRSDNPPQAVPAASCGKTLVESNARVLAAQGGILAITMQPAIDNAGDKDNGDLAPYAVEFSKRGCYRLGRATVQALRGRYAAGWRVYHGRYQSSTTLVFDRARYVAVRWYDRLLQELGPGVALDVAADGTAVGADRYPEFDQGAFEHAVRARLWQTNGHAVDIGPVGFNSIAHAVDEHGRVVGMLEHKGRFDAFLWHDGHLKTLDDLLRQPDWHFEAAFDLSSDGRVAGVGRYHGVDSIFVATIP